MTKRSLNYERVEKPLMWFVFPQLAGLGRSPTSEFYSIKDLQEAATYLVHPVLGSRLIIGVDAVLTHRDQTLVMFLAVQIILSFVPR